MVHKVTATMDESMDTTFVRDKQRSSRTMSIVCERGNRGARATTTPRGLYVEFNTVKKSFAPSLDFESE